MTIFVIPSSFPNKNNPQASIFVLEQCKALQKLGHKIVVLDSGAYSIKYWKDSDCWKMRKEKYEGLDVYRFNVPIAKRSIFKRTGSFLAGKHVKKMFNGAISEYGIPDVIYCHFSYPTGKICVKLSKQYSIRLVVEEHGGMYFSNKIDRYYINNLKIVLKDSHAFITVSESLKNRLSSLTGFNDMIVIPNLIDPMFTFQNRIKKEKFRFFSAGNLVESKRFPLLIDCFKACLDSKHNAELVIAGDGPDKDLISKYIYKLGLENNVSLLGRLSRKRILEEYKLCDCFALLSEHETFGIVYREAMAVGRPVVTTNNQGMAEGWDDSYGFMVEVDNRKQGATAMIDIMDKYEKFNLETISNKTIKLFSSDSVAERIASILLPNGNKQ